MPQSLGDVLVAQGVLDAATLERVSAGAAERGVSLGRALVEAGAASEAQVVAAVAAQVGMPFLGTGPGAVEPDAAELVSRSLATELTALPVGFDPDGALLVAIADPRNTAAVERIAAETGLRARPGLTVRADLVRAIGFLASPDTHPDASGPAAASGAGAPAGLGGVSDPAAAAAAPAGSDTPLLAFEQEALVDLDAVLGELVKRGGSDLHVTAGLPPTIRVHGELERLDGYPELTPPEIQKMIYGILTQRQREQFENELELDLSYGVPNLARFRINVFQQRDAMGAVMRIIPYEIRSIEDLGIPAQVTNFAHLPRGFVLVTGPTGSGKSTTLAALIDIVNREKACHIMTVEDPIEFLHSHKTAVVNQRELGTDTHTFAAALKHVLRQDPDVILVGEMRDLETIQVALTAAETGHLVFGTLHTQDAPQTVDRIIDVFPPHQQEQIRVMLAGALQGVVCQQLLKTPDGQGRLAVCEVMVATPAIRNLIREAKTHQIYSAIQAGASHGMITMDQSLANAVNAGKVTYEAALERCSSVPDFNRLCGRA